MISIDYRTKVITIPQDFLEEISENSYRLDVDVFRRALKSLEASNQGMPFLRTHRHSTEVILSGVVYSRFVEIINGYTIVFEQQDQPYTVSLIGANNNIVDVAVLNGNVSIISNNSAGLVRSNISDQIVDNNISVKQALKLILSSTSGKVSISQENDEIRLFDENGTLIRTLSVTNNGKNREVRNG